MALGYLLNDDVLSLGAKLVLEHSEIRHACRLALDTSSIAWICCNRSSAQGRKQTYSSSGMVAMIRQGERLILEAALVEPMRFNELGAVIN